MDKVQKPIDFECHAQSSELFRIFEINPVENTDDKNKNKLRGL
jgi:hypothetical protein